MSSKADPVLDYLEDGDKDEELFGQRTRSRAKAVRVEKTRLMLPPLPVSKTQVRPTNKPNNGIILFKRLSKTEQDWIKRCLDLDCYGRA